MPKEDFKQDKWTGLWVPSSTPEPPPFPPRLQLPGNEKVPTRMEYTGRDVDGRKFNWYGAELPRTIAQQNP